MGRRSAGALRARVILKTSLKVEGRMSDLRLKPTSLCFSMRDRVVGLGLCLPSSLKCYAGTGHLPVL